MAVELQYAMIQIVSHNGLPVAEEIKRGLSNLLRGALTSSQTSHAIQDTLRSTVRAHFQAIYPGSKHYNPQKVTNGRTSSTSTTATGSVNIDVPGVTRAYHDITIRPRIRKFLTIPIHKSAMGKSARDFTGLEEVENRNGNRFLAKRLDNGALAYMFVLKEKVFQKRNRKLMPTDEALAVGIFRRVARLLDNSKGFR